MKSVKLSILVLTTLLALSACFSEPARRADLEEYDGPWVEYENVRILTSDSAVTKITIEGPKQLQHQNGDIEFPDGMHVIIFNRFGEPISDLTAQHGFQNAEEDIYKATGDVLVVNLQKKETLSTEELFWDPGIGIIYTEKFVTIKTEDSLFPGEGLTAPQDLSSYEIKKPRDAIIKIKDPDADNN